MGDISHTQQILNHIIGIREDIGSLRQSQKDLVNQIKNNALGIESNRISITKTEVTMGKYFGGIAVLAAVFNAGLYYFFR